MTEPAGIPLGAAIHHATLGVPTAEAGQTAAEARNGLAGGSFESAREVVVLDAGGAAVGLVALETLLAAPGDRPLAEIMRRELPAVTFETDEEIAAHAMVESGAGCLVVTAADGRFGGLILPEQMLPVLLAEHDRDLARLGGSLPGPRQARGAAQEPVARRLWHRLPWLLIGLLGAMASAVLMGAFDERLEANVLIALFVPAIVYMADAVGTQTETLLIRALAVGVSVRAIVFRELVTGIVIGVAIGTAFFAFAAVGWGDVEVALAVGLALVASCTIATGVAMLLPTLFVRLKIDPAFGSGPLATVIQDLLSILAYFAVVVAIVG
jgi:magnesium transporter